MHLQSGKQGVILQLPCGKGRLGRIQPLSGGRDVYIEYYYYVLVPVVRNASEDCSRAYTPRAKMDVLL